MQNQNQITSSKDMRESWTNTEIETLSKALAVVCMGQNSYGSEKQFEARFDFWVSKLEGRYSVSQILQALNIYTDRNSDVPTPSDIIKIISPEPVKITQSEYVAAQRRLQNSGYYNPNSADAQIVKEFETQESENRKEPIADIPLSQLTARINKALENKTG